MKRYRITMTIDIDDEALSEHVEKHAGNVPPYTTDVSDWNVADIISAADEEIFDPGEGVLLSAEEVPTAS